jgi:hypothetical protein
MFVLSAGKYCFGLLMVGCSMQALAAVVSSESSVNLNPDATKGGVASELKIK